MAFSATADIYALLDAAKAGADRKREPWEAWKFLDLQIGIGAESFRPAIPPPAVRRQMCKMAVSDGGSEWAQANAQLRQRLSEIEFQNWFADSWQVDRHGDALIIGIPDAPTREWLNTEYSQPIQEILSALGISGVEYVLADSRAMKTTPEGRN